MTVDTIRSLCRTLPAVTEDVKWGHDLCFCVAGKMFTVIGEPGSAKNSRGRGCMTVELSAMFGASSREKSRKT